MHSLTSAYNIGVHLVCPLNFFGAPELEASRSGRPRLGRGRSAPESAACPQGRPPKRAGAPASQLLELLGTAAAPHVSSIGARHLRRTAQAFEGWPHAASALPPARGMPPVSKQVAPACVAAGVACGSFLQVALVFLGPVGAFNKVLATPLAGWLLI